MNTTSKAVRNFRAMSRGRFSKILRAEREAAIARVRQAPKFTVLGAVYCRGGGG